MEDAAEGANHSWGRGKGRAGSRSGREPTGQQRGRLGLELEYHPHWGTNAELRAGGGLWLGMGQNGRRGGTVTRWGAKRRESSINGYGGLTEDVITFDCSERQDPCIETRWIANQPID